MRIRSTDVGRGDRKPDVRLDHLRIVDQEAHRSPGDRDAVAEATEISWFDQTTLARAESVVPERERRQRLAEFGLDAINIAAPH